MFWEKFSRLCQERGKTPTTVVLDLGLSKSSVTYWKQGKAPHPATLAKIAEYFGVGIGALLEDQGDTNIVSVTPEEKNLFNLIKALTEDEVKQVSDYIDFVVSKRGK